MAGAAAGDAARSYVPGGSPRRVDVPLASVPDSGSDVVRPVHVDDALHFPTLDGVRFLAYFAVFLSHTVPILKVGEGLGRATRLFDAGGFGIDLFLVLSAFLITSLLLHEQDRTGTIRVRWFYVRRMLRIWPLYLVFLAAMFAATLLIPGTLGFSAIDPLYWVSFLLLAGNWYTGFHGYPGSNISPLWSISLEEQFYLLWPLLLLALRRHLVKACFVLLAVAVVARLVVAQVGLEHPAMWTFTLTRLDPIILGALLAVGYRRGLLPRLGQTAQWALLAGGFALWPAAYWLGYSQPTQTVAALVTFPLAALSAAGILLAALQSDGPVRRLFFARFMVRMGSLSYGTYVLHLLMVHVAQAALGGQSTLVYNVALLPLAFGLTWLGAEASYRWLEAPFLRLRKRFRPLATSSAAPAMAIGALPGGSMR